MKQQTQVVTVRPGSARADREPISDGKTFDAVVVGAGFAGIRMLIELRRLGLSAKVLDAATDVGGTWYWNRYPGARTDTESWAYCLSFCSETLQEWDWKERYPQQPEVEAYLRFVTDRFDLRSDMQFSTRVEAAHYDDATNRWTITTDRGETITCTYFITGLGLLSSPIVPKLAGMESFAGETYLTATWPKEKVDFAGKRVAIIGTGATGVQAVPVIAEQAAQVTVFQRTPNYVIPGGNFQLDEARNRQIKDEYEATFAQARRHVLGFPMNPAGRVFDDVTDEEREAIFEERWQRGGFHFLFETFDDIIVDQRSNDAAADFVRKKIREIVKDPVTAELLCPKNYPFVGKRPPLGHGYYEAFNRDNVSLVDVSEDRIVEVIPGGLRTESGATYEVDVLVFATGFDAVTGALSQIDIRGVAGTTLSEAWQEGPWTSLGIGVPGFPNMFTICGPQSPFGNIPIVVETVVDWISSALTRVQDKGYDRIEATADAADAWTAHNDEVFEFTLLPGGEAVNTYYAGGNVPGKPRRVLFYFGGVGAYDEAVGQSSANDFAGFTLNALATAR